MFWPTSAFSREEIIANLRYLKPVSSFRTEYAYDNLLYIVAGDDHGCVSSSMLHQSDVPFMARFMPTLNPAGTAKYEEFGLYGWALSHFSGMWVGYTRGL